MIYGFYFLPSKTRWQQFRKTLLTIDINYLTIENTFIMWNPVITKISDVRIRNVHSATIDYVAYIRCHYLYWMQKYRAIDKWQVWNIYCPLLLYRTFTPCSQQNTSVPHMGHRLATTHHPISTVSRYFTQKSGAYIQVKFYSIVELYFILRVIFLSYTCVRASLDRAFKILKLRLFYFQIFIILVYVHIFIVCVYELLHFVCVCELFRLYYLQTVPYSWFFQLCVDFFLPCLCIIILAVFFDFYPFVCFL